MVNPKKRTRKPSSEAREQTVKVPEEIPEEAEVAPTEERVARPLEEFLAEAERAHATYMDAVRGVATAYKENELQVAKAYRTAEQQAQDSCEQAIAQSHEGA